MGREDRKEDLLELFAPGDLWIANDGTRDLKWITRFQMILSPANAFRARCAACADLPNLRLPQSANTRRTSVMTPAVKPTRSTACLSVSTATARKVWTGMIVVVK